MAIKRPKVNLEFSVPRPKPKGIGDASPMAGAAKTVIPGAGGVARWTVGDEKPFTQEQLFSNDPYGTDPRDAATQRQSSVTMPQATIDAVQARRAMEANRQAGVNANIGMLGAFGAGATQGATGLGKTFEGVAGATGASQGGVPRPSVPQGVGGNIGPAAAARPALQADR